MAARILTFDLETAPLESYTWGIWEQNVGIDMVKTDWSILAYAAKWLGESTILYDDTGGRGPRRVRDDSSLLKSLWHLLDKADIVVAQNGKRFDIPRLNSRLIQSGYGPYSPVRVVDTLQVAKAQFGFTSNKLAWTSERLTDAPKSKHKKFPGFELWEQCLKDNPAAWAEMKKYNIQDVVATEKLYKKLRPWINNHPNLGVYRSGDGKDLPHVCPSCASSNVVKWGAYATQQGSYQRYHCKECGGWSRGRKKVERK